ncbi:MAG TPA: hypothetical protein VKP02_15485 [Gemmatimonadaceae bacterium]|nr:hypothetical protein [Gemmatimonadaceae bacterium]
MRNSRNRMRRLTVMGAVTMGAFALTLSTSSCAMMRHGARAGRPGLEVVVSNDVRPARDVVVFLQRPNGVKLRLGTVESDSTRTLTYPSQLDQGDYQLVAQDNTGIAVVSQHVSLSSNEQRVVWQPGARNAVTSILR